MSNLRKEVRDLISLNEKFKVRCCTVIALPMTRPCSSVNVRANCWRIFPHRPRGGDKQPRRSTGTTDQLDTSDNETG
jgi:hypothetical protein